METPFKMAERCGPKKHNCTDCRMCQMCSDSRCAACRSEKPVRKKLSVAEQIARFEEINRQDDARPDEPMRITV